MFSHSLSPSRFTQNGLLHGIAAANAASREQHNHPAMLQQHIERPFPAAGAATAAGSASAVTATAAPITAKVPTASGQPEQQQWPIGTVQQLPPGHWQWGGAVRFGRAAADVPGGQCKVPLRAVQHQFR